MSLTLVHRKTLPAGTPRRPLDGFSSPGLQLVCADGSLRPRRRIEREEVTERAQERSQEPVARQKRAAKVLSFVPHRREETGLPEPAVQAKRGRADGRDARWLMYLAAATPPMAWAVHALLHLAHVL